ncbi:tryptophan transporter [Jeotgalibacillus alimentarius]|uniref:Tryptophan transporter n=2 Tax=Jeotgalibacillus TaxID=157226 RepID=A0A0C2S7Z8_9BACL|nr:MULTISPECIES: tryptophan transporter [Jeotgalibacillus]KIL50129.1 tryptophan transporter [Jeotgalibacillus alimentarius]MBM7579823.1 ABC-type siderophore export system fused ATPase/permease subunit [Jeotgalibacillus terrae]
MNTRTLVALALFAGMGTALHLLIPGALTMKPDMSLLMMFLGILLFPGVKNVLVIGLATGILSGLTTTFPGGFLPNVIDKPITAFAFYGIILLAGKLARKPAGAAVLAAVGTLISGTIFLGSAALLVGLPGPIMALALSAVVPAIVVNGLLMAVMYPVAQAIMKRSNLVESAA